MPFIVHHHVCHATTLDDNGFTALHGITMCSKDEATLDDNSFATPHGIRIRPEEQSDPACQRLQRFPWDTESPVAGPGPYSCRLHRSTMLDRMFCDF